MRNLKRIQKLATLTGIALLAACTDSAPTAAPAAVNDIVAPALPSVVASQAVVAEEVDAPIASGHGTMATVYPSNAVTYQFTYAPTTSSAYIMGVHMVSFPRNTICDPSVSSYGPGTWLDSCTKLTSPISITATVWKDAAGRVQIDFSNAIRFYKNENGQLPAIYLRDPSAAITSWGRVDYCSGNGCVNEAATDTSLGTQREAITGYLFRIIRHFSGYNVWA